MPSKQVLGQYKRLFISEDSGVSWSEVAKLMNVSLSRQRGIVQANDNTNVNFVQKLPSRSDHKISCQAHDDFTDPGQMLVRKYSAKCERIRFKYLPYAEIGRRKFMGFGYITTETDNAGDDQVETLDFSIEIDGGLVGSAPDAETIDAGDLPPMPLAV